MRRAASHEERIYQTGGATLATVATYAGIASAAISIGGQLGLFGGKDKGAGGAPSLGSPVADENAANDTARANAIARRRAIASKSPRSLLATMGSGDLTAAPVGQAGATPGGKQTLGGA
jgi:hypothetical protein